MRFFPIPLSVIVIFCYLHSDLFCPSCYLEFGVSVGRNPRPLSERSEQETGAEGKARFWSIRQGAVYHFLALFFHHLTLLSVRSLFMLHNVLITGIAG